MNRSEIKRAILDEVVRFSGVAESSTIWDRQKVGARPLPAIELRLEGGEGVGALNGERLEEYDPASGEIVVAVVRDLEIVLRVQARAETHDGAHDVAKASQRAFTLPSPARRLYLAGVVVVDVGPVLDVGEQVETKWQGRAAYTVRIRVGDVEVDPERTTFIDSAPVTGTVD